MDEQGLRQRRRVIGTLAVGNAVVFSTAVLAATFVGPPHALRDSRAANAPPVADSTRAPFPSWVRTTGPRFSFQMPVAPLRQDQTVPAPGPAAVVVHIYAAEVETNAFAFGYADIGGQAAPEAFFDGARRAAASYSGGTIATSIRGTFAGRPTDDIVINAATGHLFGRLLLDGHRFYELLVITPSVTAPPEYRRFVRSFAFS